LLKGEKAITNIREFLGMPDIPGRYSKPKKVKKRLMRYCLMKSARVGVISGKSFLTSCRLVRTNRYPEKGISLLFRNYSLF